jgi:hypothetical protein
VPSLDELVQTGVLAPEPDACGATRAAPPSSSSSSSSAKEVVPCMRACYAAVGPEKLRAAIAAMGKCVNELTVAAAAAESKA